MNAATPESRAALVEAPMSVWATGQRAAASQRRGRYVPASTAHPAKMLPAIAATAISRFTRPGDVVLDPMCGIGTTLIEAAHLGRSGLGVEYEDRWVDIAQANLALATSSGAAGDGAVNAGDARDVLPTLTDTHAGRVRLLLTSPPYGASVHGQVTAVPAASRGVLKRDDSYGQDRANLAHHDLPVLLRGFTDILRASVPLLAADAVVAITTRPFRVDGALVDFPALTLDAATAAGLVPVQRCVALLAGIRDGRLVPRASFFQLDYVRKLRARGVPVSVIAHEDLLILTKVDARASGTRRAPVPAAAATSIAVPRARPEDAAPPQTGGDIGAGRSAA